MAQSEATVTYISPTPPTNLLCVEGGSPPSSVGLEAADDGTAGALNALVPPTGGNVAECTGSIVTVTAPGSRAECPTLMVSTLGAFTAKPNADHASQKAPAVAPTITALDPVAPAAGQGTVTLKVTGTGFRPDSVVTLGGVPYPTQYTSATELKVINAPKKLTAGTVAVSVLTGGTAITATNWTFS
jgi:hypothetical protein